MDTNTTTRFLAWVRETIELSEAMSISTDPFERHLGQLLRADVDTALTPATAEVGLTIAPRPEMVAKRRGRPPGSRNATLNKPLLSGNGEGSEAEPESGAPIGDGEPTTPCGESDSTEGADVNQG
jgi:hypothetical protein